VTSACRECGSPGMRKLSLMNWRSAYILDFKLLQQIRF
jgi:hypothetical protein